MEDDDCVGSAELASPFLLAEACEDMGTPLLDIEGRGTVVYEPSKMSFCAPSR
jgi:hypothetical protein